MGSIVFVFILDCLIAKVNITKCLFYVTDACLGILRDCSIEALIF